MLFDLGINSEYNAHSVKGILLRDYTISGIFSTSGEIQGTCTQDLRKLSRQR